MLTTRFLKKEKWFQNVPPISFSMSAPQLTQCFGCASKRGFSTSDISKDGLASTVDEYFTSRLVLPRSANFVNPDESTNSQSRFEHLLSKVLKNNARNGLPPHDVSPNQGQLLALYVSLVQARRVLEVGTLGGYSTIWMARNLHKDGRITTLEINEKHADVARGNFLLCGIQNQVEIKTGPALDHLSKLAPGFDLAFIDADKVNNKAYFEHAMTLTRRKGLIVVDNVVRGGEVVNASSQDPSVLGVRALTEYMKTLVEERIIQATVVQTVGIKGWDGYILAQVL